MYKEITDKQLYNQLNKIIRYVKDDSYHIYRNYTGYGYDKSEEARNQARDTLIECVLMTYRYYRSCHHIALDIEQIDPMCEYIYKSFPLIKHN